MQGSTYYDGVLVDRVALRRTELTKAAEILRGRLDWTSRGVYSGGEVTVNGVDTTKVDIAIASGFTPNGEYVETDSTYLQQSLSDYTATTVNYVGLVYTEVNTDYQPHETDVNTYATNAEMSWRLRIYTEAEYNALSLTDDNLANDPRDRFLILAKVTANGAGVPLTPSSIVSPTAYDNLLYASPVDPITGTSITAIDPDMSTGLGTLDWDSAGSTLTWTSYGGGAGAAVPVTIDQTYTLLDGAGYYMYVLVVVSQLPASNTSANVTITNLYYQNIPRQTAEDFLHRNLQGTGVVGPHNPHGLSVTDVSGEDLPQIEEHQDIMHCNGIWRGSNGGIFSPTINTAAPNGDTLFIQQPVSGDLFYVNGVKCQNANPGSFLFTPANFTAGDFGPTVKEGAKLYEIYIDDEEVTTINLRTDTNPATLPARTVTGTWIVDISDEHPAGSYELKCTVAAGPIYTFTWGDGVTDGLPVVIDNTLPPTVPTEGQTIRLYAPDGVNWIDLYLNRSASGPNADSKLPGAGALTDTIEVYNHLVYEEYMKVLHAVYWYNGTRGTVGWEADFSGAGDRHTIDKRSWGTLCSNEIADEGLEVTDYTSTDEFHYSGVLFAREDWGGNFVTSYGGAGLTFPLTGGSYYCRGEKLSVESEASLSVSDNTSTLIYADYDGSIQVLDIGAATEFSNDLSAALRWVMGSSFDRKYQSDVFFVNDEENYAERGVPLYYLVTSGGNVTRWLDVSRNVNGPIDPWSVGQRRSDPYDATLTTYLAAFDNLEAAFVHAGIYQDTVKDQRKFVEIKIVGDTSIFSESSVSQPNNTRVTGIPDSSSLTSITAVVTSYRDDLAGCWLLGSGCSVSGVNLKFDAAVTSSTFFGFNTTEIHNVTIEHCEYTGDSGAYFINFNAVTALAKNVNIIDNVMTVGRGLIYDPASNVATNYDFNISGNYMYSEFVQTNEALVDLRFGSELFGAVVRDNMIHHYCYYNGAAAINVGDTCIGVVVDSNYIAIRSSSTYSYLTKGIQADGHTEVRNNFIRGDNTFGAIGAAPDLNTIAAIYVEDDSNSTVIESNTILYAGIGVYLTSIVNKTVSNNKILDCYNRGIYAIDDGGDDTLYGLKITENYITGSRSASTSGVYVFDNYVRAIDVVITVNVGTDPLSDIVIKGNVIPYVTSLCSSSANVYGIHVVFNSSGAGSSPPIRNIAIDYNYIDNLVPEATQSAYGIALDNDIDLPYSVDPADGSIDNLSICNNRISCDPTSTFNVFTGIVLPDYDLNTYNFSVSDNLINVLATDPTLTSYGIYGGYNYRINIENNSIASNATSVRIRIRHGVIDGNNIISKSFGMYLVSGEDFIISNNEIICQTEYDMATSVVGIYINSSTGDDANSIINNIVLLKGNSAANILASNGITRSSNIETAATVSNFIISGNITKQSYSSITGAGPASHIYAHPSAATYWSIDNNKIYNVHVKGTGTISDSDGLYVVSTGGRGVIADNIMFGSNSNITGAFFELAVTAGPGIVTLNNNRMMLIYTGPGAEVVNGALVGVTAEPVLTNIQDSYNAGGAYVGVPF